MFLCVCLFVEIRTDSARMVQLCQNCSSLCQIYVCEGSSNLSQIGSKWARLVIIRQVWFKLFQVVQIRQGLSMFGQGWSKIGQIHLGWSRFVQIWPGRSKYDQAGPSFTRFAQLRQG